jgi:hypothetical protein
MSRYPIFLLAELVGANVVAALAAASKSYARKSIRVRPKDVSLLWRRILHRLADWGCL